MQMPEEIQRGVLIEKLRVLVATGCLLLALGCSRKESTLEDSTATAAQGCRGGVWLSAYH